MCWRAQRWRWCVHKPSSAKDGSSYQKLEARPILLWSLQREHGPADTIVSNFEAPELRVHQLLLFQATQTRLIRYTSHRNDSHSDFLILISGSPTSLQFLSVVRGKTSSGLRWQTCLAWAVQVHMEVNPGAHGEIHLCRRAELDEPRQAHQIEDMWKEKLSFGLSSSYVKASLTHPNSRGGGCREAPGLSAGILFGREDGWTLGTLFTLSMSSQASVWYKICGQRPWWHKGWAIFALYFSPGVWSSPDDHCEVHRVLSGISHCNWQEPAWEQWGTSASHLGPLFPARDRVLALDDHRSRFSREIGPMEHLYLYLCLY